MITSSMVVLYNITDMDAALAFYKEALGFGSVFESDGWSTLRVNEHLEVGLHGPVKARADHLPHPFDAGETTLALTVDDLEACIPRIEAHGGRVERIVEPEGGRRSRVALVWDPCENGIQVNQVVDQVVDQG